MSDVFPLLFFFLYGGGIVLAIILIIYFAIKRVEAKKKETFEDRDN